MSEKLHVDSVIKSYGDNQILTDVFLSCEKGEIVGLLGRNGSGKSTLLKVIFGAISAERKFVRAEGEIINSISDAKRYINYLAQDNFLPNHLSVKQVIQLYCSKGQVEKVATNNIIKPVLSKKCKTLSGGERRMLEVLIVVFSPAKYILIDEPFNGIAPIYKDEIKALIHEQSKEKGFVITDHDYRNVLDVSTRIILLHDGGTKVITDREDLSEYGYLPEG